MYAYFNNENMFSATGYNGNGFIKFDKSTFNGV